MPNPVSILTDVSDDLFLGDRLSLLQPTNGFRAGLDSIILAASLNTRSAETLYEPGSGVGVASLCAAIRLPHIRVIGLELDQAAYDLACANAARNRLADRVTFMHGAISDPPEDIRNRTFDQVFLNPPYVQHRDGNVAPDPSRARAHAGDADGPTLEEWIGHTIRRLKPRGRLTLIQRADKVDRILQAFSGEIGDVILFPLWPMAGRPAKRVVISGRRSVQGGMMLAPGLVLHRPDGQPTPELEAIARFGQGLDLFGHAS